MHPSPSRVSWKRFHSVATSRCHDPPLLLHPQFLTRCYRLLASCILGATWTNYLGSTHTTGTPCSFALSTIALRTSLNIAWSASCRSCPSLAPLIMLSATLPFSFLGTIAHCFLQASLGSNSPRLPEALRCKLKYLIKSFSNPEAHSR